MNVTEIFGSIDGEGIRAGELATFIRFGGCNLHCFYCDTEYSLTADNSTEMSIKEIIDICKEIGYKNITITGGEPLCQTEIKRLILELLNAGFNINIETNGSRDISDFLMLDNVVITMDYKTISSGMNSKMILNNIEKLRSTDILKIVMQKSDFDDVKTMLENHNIKSWVYFSPVYSKIEYSDLVDFQKECHNNKKITDRIRTQVQLHKIIWDINKRGV